MSDFLRAFHTTNALATAVIRNLNMMSGRFDSLDRDNDDHLAIERYRTEAIEAAIVLSRLSREWSDEELEYGLTQVANHVKDKP